MAIGEYDTSATGSGGYYLDPKLPGAGDISDGPDGEGVWGALWSGGGEVRGKVESAMKSTNPDALKKKGAHWTSVAKDVDGYERSMSGIYSKIAGAWSGDDADQALKTLNGLYATIRHQASNTHNIGSALSNMGDNLDRVKKSWGHDSSFGGGLSNWAVGNEDRDAANDYDALMKNFKQNAGIMPHSVPTQVKPVATPNPSQYEAPNPHANTPSAPHVGAGSAGAPHSGNAPTTHIQQPTLHNPNTTDPNIHNPNIHNPNYTDPSIHDPNLSHAANAHGVGGVSPYDGGGTGVGGLGGTSPGLDTGGSLAGLGGAGAGGLGVGDPSGGLGAGGGLSGLGAGAGAGGLGAGAGAGGLGAGAGAAGAGAGAGASGAGAGGGMAAGAGGRGMMMPMHGGGESDEDERDRSTWLSEDDDVWGNEDDVPGVIR